MRAEARFALAVFLMLVVLIGTNRLFPPIVPEEGLLPDSAGGDVAGEVVETGAVPVVPTPASAPESAGPTEPAGRGDSAAVETEPERLVEVEGPLYRLAFSTYGARLLSAELPQFAALNREGTVDLIPEGVGGYLGQKLVVGSDTVDLSSAPFSVTPSDGLQLSEGSGPRTLAFSYRHPTSDFLFTVEYTFSPEAYVVGVRGSAEGVANPLLLTDLGEGVAYAEADSAQEARLMGYVRNHAQEGIEATLFDKAEQGIVTGPLLWTAVKSKFFVVALLAGESDEALEQVDQLGGLIVGPAHTEGRVRVAAAQTVRNDGSYRYRLFMGPMEYARLSALGQGLEEVNPYGWRVFRPIVRPFVSIILTVLTFLHNQLTWSYGWVLVFFGVLMRIVFFPLYHKAMKAQLKNMAVQPLVQDIQKRYKDQPEKLQKEMMKLYKEHGFNPLAGCLPMLLPWPVLIALFFVFQNTIELRGVPFLWLADLSAKDPYYALPLLMAVSMFLMQWVSLKSIDSPNPQMKMMMYFMPPMMLFIFANLPSGLNLYYATTNIATIPQQIWIANERKKMKGSSPPVRASE